MSIKICHSQNDRSHVLTKITQILTPRRSIAPRLWPCALVFCPACPDKNNLLKTLSQKLDNLSAAVLYYQSRGGIAQLVRALRWHRRGHKFESCCLHQFLKRSVFTDLFVFRLAETTSSSLVKHAPHAVTMHARVSRHYRALPFPSLGARCKASLVVSTIYPKDPIARAFFLFVSGKWWR